MYTYYSIVLQLLEFMNAPMCPISFPILLPAPGGNHIKNLLAVSSVFDSRVSKYSYIANFSKFSTLDIAYLLPIIEDEDLVSLCHPTTTIHILSHFLST